MILTRNVFQLLPVFLLIFSFLSKKFLKECLLLILVSFIIISPYVIRNKIIFGSYKLSFNAGRNILNVTASIPMEDSKRLLELFDNDPALADREYFRLAVKETFTHPSRTLKLIVINSVFLLFSFDMSMPNRHYSNLRILLIIKNVITLMLIIFYGFRKETFCGCIKRIDFLFMALTFFYYHVISSLGVCDDVRYGLFSQILLYIILVLILDQYFSNQKKVKPALH